MFPCFIRVVGLLVAVVVFFSYMGEITTLATDIIFSLLPATVLDDPHWHLWKYAFTMEVMLLALVIGFSPAIVAEGLAQMCTTRARRRWQSLRDREVEDRERANRAQSLLDATRNRRR